MLSAEFGTSISAADFLAYAYGLLAQPAYTERFEEKLGTRELRVPVTKNGVWFQEVAEVGASLLWLHTYGERYVPDGEQQGHPPPGNAQCTKAVPSDPARYPEEYRYEEETGILFVGEGEFTPVLPEVYEFEVSGLKVVQSWLSYRMKEGAGRKSSPLDEIRPEGWIGQFTTELLELLWVLEATVEQYPRQAALLDKVLQGPLFHEDELPDVPEKARKAPRIQRKGPRSAGLGDPGAL